MNIKRLKEAIALLEDDTEVIAFSYATECQYGTENVTIDTDMRTGATVLTICVSEIEAGNLRDFEQHPGFEDINNWLWDE